MIAADECETNQQPFWTEAQAKGHQGYGTFALVDADGAISVGCPGGLGKQSVCLLLSSCDGLGDAIDRERDEGYIGLHLGKAKDLNWVFGERRMVFVEPGSIWTYAGANGRGIPFSEQTAMTIADGAPCALLGGWQRGRCMMNSSGRHDDGEAVERTAKLRYNFETGMWNNDQGEKFKNGVRVEWDGEAWEKMIMEY
jgi:hypothetical protein